MRSRLPRKVNPASIQRGDLIRVSWITDDTRRTIEGTVASRDLEGSVRVFLTAGGHELLRWHPSINAKITVTLLAESKEFYDTPMLDIFREQERV